VSQDQMKTIIDAMPRRSEFYVNLPSLIELAETVPDDILAVVPVSSGVGGTTFALVVTPTRFLLTDEKGTEVVSFKDARQITAAVGRKKLFGFDNSYLRVDYGATESLFSTSGDHDYNAEGIRIAQKAFEKWRLANT
jgi:hypothetical protein